MRYAFVALLLGCQATTQEVAWEELSACDPLDPTLCGLPFPNSFHTRPADTPTGVRLAFTEDGLPVNKNGGHFDPTMWNELDGFAIGSGLLTFMPDVDPSDFVSHLDLQASLESSSTSILLDTTTGELVAHWVELDHTSPEGQRLTLVRPAVPLEFDHDYVMAFRGLKTLTGADWPASEAFLALRDELESAAPDVNQRRGWFDERVFAPLEQAGWSRDELQLAWDFHTASREYTLGRALAMRDDALDIAGPQGPAYVLDELDGDLASCVGDNPPKIGLTINGTFSAPRYTESEFPMTPLVARPGEAPASQGLADVPFRIRIPCSAVQGLEESGQPTPLLQYGHGLLGDHGEVSAGWLASQLDRTPYITFAVSWTGMKTQDAGGLALAVAIDIGRFGEMPERVHQGLIEFELAMAMMSGAMVDEPALQWNGQPLIDPSQRYYYGNSQGGIIGAAYMAMTEQIDRGVLGVPGGPYGLLLNRSADFDDFLKIFREMYPERDLEVEFMVVGMLQQVWDAAEPSGWSWEMTRDTDHPKQILLHPAIGDSQVTPLGAHIMARAYGASTVAPETRPVWGVPEREPGFEGSALVEFLYSDVPDEPIENIPPQKSTDTHECPRRQLEAQDQIDIFLRTGVVEQTCDGPCVRPRAGLCD